MVQIILTNKNETLDITDYVDQIVWSGDYQQCARTLSFSLISNNLDSNVPIIPCELGNSVLLMDSGSTLFDGFIFTRSKSTDTSLIEVTCFDRGFYLKKNRASYQVNNIAPGAMTQQICKDFEITTGDIIEPGNKIKRKFLGVSLYDMIQTMYTLASQEDGRSYMIRFAGDKLCVLEKKAGSSSLIIDGDTNLMGANTSETVENMINQVAIYGANDELIKTVKDDQAIASFGLMQDYLKQSGEDLTKKADKMIADNGVKQKITVENLGAISCITGNTVIVRETYTGLYGLFYIDSDTHTWKNGQYFNRLTLNYKSMMDEKEVGQLWK